MGGEEGGDNAKMKAQGNLEITRPEERLAKITSIVPMS